MGSGRWGEVILFGLVGAPESLMDPVLRRIDQLLDDERLVGAVWRVLRQRRPQSARRGRPGTPAETVLRLLVPKHLKGPELRPARVGSAGQRGVSTALEAMVPRARQVLRQTRARVLQGTTTSAGKLVSLFEPYARIIRKGKLHRPTEFGVLVKVQEAEGGIVTDIGIIAGTSDTPLQVPAVERRVAVLARPPNDGFAAAARGGPGERPASRASSITST